MCVEWIDSLDTHCGHLIWSPLSLSLSLSLCLPGASSAGNTALTYACCGGYEEVVRLLLEAGAEVEHQNENGHTPLMEAASCGHVGGCGFPHSVFFTLRTHLRDLCLEC